MPDTSHFDPAPRPVKIEPNAAFIRYLSDHPGATARDVYSANPTGESLVNVIHRLRALVASRFVVETRDARGDRRYRLPREEDQ